MMKEKEMEQHLTILAVLHIAWSAMGLLGAVIIFTFVTGGGMLSGDIEVMTITTTIGSSIAFLLTITNLPQHRFPFLRYNKMGRYGKLGT